MGKHQYEHFWDLEGRELLASRHVLSGPVEFGDESDGDEEDDDGE